MDADIIHSAHLLPTRQLHLLADNYNVTVVLTVVNPEKALF